MQARQKMEYQAFTNILEVLLVTGAGLFILFYSPSVKNLSYSYLFAALVALIFVLVLFHFKIQRLSLNWNKSIWQRFLSISWPLALVGLLASIYNQTDSVMLGYFNQITQTGWYNAAYRIIGATFIPVALVSTSIFPVLSKSFNESKEKLQKVWNYYTEIIIFLAIPLIIGGLFLASKIIDFIYDSTYTPSVLAFQILIIMAGIIFLYNPFIQVLIVSDQQKKIFWAVLSGAIINVILNLILIPKFSLYGAAIATVITHLLIFFSLVRLTLKSTPINPFNMRIFLSLIGAIFSSIPMYFVISQPQIYYLNVFLSILIGAGVYSICFLLYKELLGKISLIKNFKKDE